MDGRKSVTVRDRWVPWLLLLPLVYPAIMILSPVFRVSNFVVVFLFLPIWLIGALVISIAAVVVLARSFKQHLRKRAASAILFLTLVAFFFIATPILSSIGDIASFYTMRPVFQHKVDSLSGDEKDKLVVFTMDGWITMSNGFAFDGSDEMALPAGKQSDAWKKRAMRTELSGQCWGARHITGHYYAWTAAC